MWEASGASLDTGFHLSAFQLPHDVAAEMKPQSLAVTVVLNFVLDLRAGDQLIACDAHVSGAVARVDSIRHVTRQLTVFDLLANVLP